MKDNLTDLLQARFSGHEMPVDPGVWEAVSGQLSVAQGEALRQTLQEKFNGHEANVDPSAWAHISNQLGHGAAAGTGVGAGWIAAGITALVVTSGVLWYSSSNESTLAPASVTATPVVAEQVAADPLPASPIVPDKSVVVTTTTLGSEPQASRVHSMASTRRSLEVVSEPVSAPDHGPNEGTAPANNAPSPARPTEAAPTGAEVVAAVLQQEVANVTATPKPPEPEKHETIPPPTENDMPEKGLVAVEPDGQPTTATEDDPVTTEPSETAELTVWIPNVFSPNGDGANDRLEVKADHYQADKVRVRIFSASAGALVFTANSLDVYWTGRDLRGNKCDPGFYFYAIELVGSDGHTYNKGETVRLYRE